MGLIFSTFLWPRNPSCSTPVYAPNLIQGPVEGFVLFFPFSLPVAFSWFFRGFFVALILGKFYAYSPWKSLLICFPSLNLGNGNRRALLGTLDTQTPKQASKNPAWFPEGSWKARSGASVPRGPCETD